MRIKKSRSDPTIPPPFRRRVSDGPPGVELWAWENWVPADVRQKIDDGIKDVWNATTKTVSDGWNSVTSGVSDAWEAIF